MKKKGQWWTLQLVPHRNGEVLSYRIQFLSAIIGISFALFILSSVLISCYYLWSMNHSLQHNVDELTLIESENSRLKAQLHEITDQMIDLHQDIDELQEWLKEMQGLEKELRNGEATSLHSSTIDELAIKTSSVRISNQDTAKKGGHIDSFSQLEEVKKNFNG
ncbi:hypothetical protein [Caldalkalibacillus mannanilyticus]|uniref:hypothetical protein n=1 Tax=Caldalkalibacillus mannanilyticus TaxID=1418 RepID=UPI0004694BE7|nr:hypothetical protein [Caldalkalibacillus mannanilyticus]